MHTPAKGADPNKGLGGSNPPFSARKSNPCGFKPRGFFIYFSRRWNITNQQKQGKNRFCSLHYGLSNRGQSGRQIEARQEHSDAFRLIDAKHWTLTGDIPKCIAQDAVLVVPGARISPNQLPAKSRPFA
jgi:hypothetical protein